MNIKILLCGVLIVILMAGLWWYFFSEKKNVGTEMDMIQSNETLDDSINIIAFGDSLTAGYGVSQSEAYPAQLEFSLQEKGYIVKVINSGVSGETTRGNLERTNFIRAQNPDIVILGIGGNDALRNLPLEETEKNIRATVKILQSGEQPPHVILLHMQAPLNAGREYKQQFDALYETIANEYQIVLLPFIVDAVFLDTKNKLPDGIHYNQRGYQQIVARYIMPHITNLLDGM